MNMNREAYKLANEIRTDLLTDDGRLMESPEDIDMAVKRYEKAALQEIHKEKKAAGKRLAKRTAAACAVVALAGTAVFSGEVHAAIRQITWSIESALGLSGDLADYRDVIHTSVADKGYVITLQEAVISEEKLTVNYTLQREDEQPVETYLTPVEALYVNGKRVTDGGSRGSADFLDETHKVLGLEMSYDIPDMDLSAENEYRIEIKELGMEERIKGNWDFAFTADGAALMADTRRITIGKEFTLPDGVTVTLEELTMNELEQRISFKQSGSTRYLIQIMAEDSEGHQVEFGLRSSDARSGYMSNEEILYDGRIADTAGQVTMTLNAVELPEESGRISDDYVQVGDTFELNLQ